MFKNEILKRGFFNFLTWNVNLERCPSAKMCIFRIPYRSFMTSQKRRRSPRVLGVDQLLNLPRRVHRVVQMWRKNRCWVYAAKEKNVDSNPFLTNEIRRNTKKKWFTSKYNIRTLLRQKKNKNFFHIMVSISVFLSDNYVFCCRACTFCGPKQIFKRFSCFSLNDR